MQSYDTVVAALNGLKDRGYTLDFNVSFDKLICSDNKVNLNPHEFEIVEVYRFEGETNPSDEDVVYAVESKQGNIKGTFTSAYGMYSDAVSTDMMKKMAMHTDKI
jgi:hypothetical protein